MSDWQVIRLRATGSDLVEVELERERRVKTPQGPANLTEKAAIYVHVDERPWIGQFARGEIELRDPGE